MKFHFGMYHRWARKVTKKAFYLLYQFWIWNALWHDYYPPLPQYGKKTLLIWIWFSFEMVRTAKKRTFLKINPQFQIRNFNVPKKVDRWQDPTITIYYGQTIGYTPFYLFSLYTFPSLPYTTNIYGKGRESHLGNPFPQNCRGDSRIDAASIFSTLPRRSYPPLEEAVDQSPHTFF